MVFPHPDGVFGDCAGRRAVPRAIGRAVHRGAVRAGHGHADGVAGSQSHIGTWTIALTVAMALTTARPARGAAAAGRVGRARRDSGVRAPDGARADRARGRDAVEWRADVSLRTSSGALEYRASIGVDSGPHAGTRNPRRTATAPACSSSRTSISANWSGARPRHAALMTSRNIPTRST